jgi:formylglycine-generating enzyme required for sulfatase activity
MGASRREPGRRANESLREVELTRPFYLGTMEISNDQFRAFDNKHMSGAVGSANLELDDHPVVRVTWEEAALYCNWLSQQESLRPIYQKVDGRVVAARPLGTGYRLPTEAEWAWSARYAGRQNPVKYPWGDALPVKRRSGNYAGMTSRGLVPSTLEAYNDGYPGTAPVHSFALNPIGIYNFGGNAAEWVHDIYMIHASGGVDRDPIGPGEGELHVIRGSSWQDAKVTELRLTYRDYGRKPRPDVGFRIARYAE